MIEELYKNGELKINVDCLDYDNLIQVLDIAEKQFPARLNGVPQEIVDCYKERLYTQLFQAVKPLLSREKGVMKRLYKFVYDKRYFTQIYADTKIVLMIGSCLKKGDKDKVKELISKLDLPEDLETKVLES